MKYNNYIGFADKIALTGRGNAELDYLTEKDAKKMRKYLVVTNICIHPPLIRGSINSFYLFYLRTRRACYAACVRQRKHWLSLSRFFMCHVEHSIL